MYLSSNGPKTHTDFFEQNFFTKAALTIVSARVVLPKSFTKTGEIKQNKWVCHVSISL